MTSVFYGVRSSKTQRACGLAAVLVASLLTKSVNAGDWPAWRGPNHDGVSLETGLPDSTQQVLWRTANGGRSTPVVHDGQVYVINLAGQGVTEQERVMAISLETGRTIWEHRFNVFHTDIPNSRVGWTSPVVDVETGNIYAHGVGGMFFCFSRDGKVLWSHSLTETVGRISGYGGRTHTPILDEDRVIISFLNSSFGDQGRGLHRYLALDKRTGEMLWWSAPGGAPLDTTYSVPVVTIVNGERLIIAGNADGGIYALRSRTGEKVWEFQLSKRGINSSIVADGYRVYATHSEENLDSTEMGRVVCIDARGTGDVTESHELWRADGVAAGYASPALHDGRLYVMNNFGVLYCFDADSGKELWQHTVGRVGKGSPIVADGKIYVATVNGIFTILKDAGSHAVELDTMHLEGDENEVIELFGSPAVADGRVLFFDTKELICLGTDNAGPRQVQLPALPSETAVGAAAVSFLQVRPAEVLVKPGEQVSFRAIGFNDVGQQRGTVPAEWTYQPTGSAIDANGNFTAPGPGGSIGTITAQSGELTAQARVRVVPELPIAEDFESYGDGELLNWWIGVSKAKYAIETLDGSQVLKKLSDNRGPKFNRSRVYITPPMPTGYTVQADVRGVMEKRRRGDAGLINARYRLELIGNISRLRVISWVPGPRFEAKIEGFKWEPDRWYRVKFRVDLADGKAYPKVKVWPRDEQEPADWMLEAEDPQPNLEGSAGIYAYSLKPVYFDNVRVYRDASDTQ
jgi:outer membrane protein assembly factor BamB